MTLGADALATDLERIYRHLLTGNARAIAANLPPECVPSESQLAMSERLRSIGALDELDLFGDLEVTQDAHAEVHNVRSDRFDAVITITEDYLGDPDSMILDSIDPRSVRLRLDAREVTVEETEGGNGRHVVAVLDRTFAIEEFRIILDRCARTDTAFRIEA